VKFTSAHLYSNYMPVDMARSLADLSDFGLLGEQSSQTFDSVPWTPMNRRAKCDAANFILGGEIRIYTNTNTHTHKTHTYSKRYIHTLSIGMYG